MTNCGQPTESLVIQPYPASCTPPPWPDLTFAAPSEWARCVNRGKARAYAPVVIARIQSHNTGKGVAFVICEFALMALIVAPLGVAWALTQRPLHAMVAAGIVANCLCVVGIGVQAWRAGERGSSLRLLFSSANRANLSKYHPRMSGDSLAIMVGILVPFGLALLTLLDYSRSRDR